MFPNEIILDLCYNEERNSLLNLLEFRRNKPIIIEKCFNFLNRSNITSILILCTPVLKSHNNFNINRTNINKYIYR